MTGLSRYTASAISGWPHVIECITDIITTPKGSRVMRRDYGSDVPALIDMPMNDAVVLDLFVAVADAVDTWEPRVRIEQLGIVLAEAGGRFGLAIVNPRYFPRGHLGDYSIEERPGDLTIFIR